MAHPNGMKLSIEYFLTRSLATPSPVTWTDGRLETPVVAASDLNSVARSLTGGAEGSWSAAFHASPLRFAASLAVANLTDSQREDQPHPPHWVLTFDFDRSNPVQTKRQAMVSSVKWILPAFSQLFGCQYAYVHLST